MRVSEGGDFDLLVAEGERLARPCLRLVTGGGGQPVGVWRGAGQQPRPPGHLLDPSPRISSNHWITVDCAWLKEQRIVPFDGLLSLYERIYNQGERQEYAAILQGPKVPLSSVQGDLLCGIEATSHPPFEALCMHGGPEIENWLVAMGKRRVDYEDIHLQSHPAVRQYRQFWEQRTPWWTDGADGTVAVLGGWHVMWPEDDWYMPPDIRLAIWTFRDSEPWLEVWRGARNFRVFERIT